MGDSKDKLPIEHKKDSDYEQTETKGIFRRYLAKIKSLFYRLEVHSGAYIFKIILWIAMAWGIVRFSTDINAKLISALTYFVGIMMDMVLLRKQLPERGVECLRFFVSVSIVIFFVIAVILILGTMESANDLPVQSWMDEFITISLYACGITSTLFELVHSISADD